MKTRKLDPKINKQDEFMFHIFIIYKVFLTDVFARSSVNGKLLQENRLSNNFRNETLLQQQ